MDKSIALIFFGDFFFDARCINMADTIIDAGVDLNIIDAGESDDQYRGKKIHHIYQLLPFYKNIQYNSV